MFVHNKIRRCVVRFLMILESGVDIAYIGGSVLSKMCARSKRGYVSNQCEEHIKGQTYSAIGWFATRHISILCDREYWMSAPGWGNQSRSAVPI